MSSTHQEIFDFIAEQVDLQVGYDRENVKGTSSLTHDLKVIGDDAYALLCDLQDKYTVDFDGFDFGRFIVSEGLFLDPINWLPGSFEKLASRCERLTVDHLVEVCYQQKWFDPE